MRILMCVENDSRDSRVQRAARALGAAEHKVFVLALQRAGGPAEEGLGYAIALRRIPLQPLAKKALRYLRFSIRGLDPLWYGHIARAVREYDIDVIHVHDLPLVNTGLKIACRKGIPVVADLHENYPDLVSISRAAWRGRAAALMIPPGRWRRFEKAWLERVDRIITVIDEMSDRLVSDYDISRQKITTVMNTVELGSIMSMPISEDILKRYEPWFTVMYMGNFGPHRGIQTAILAMPRILRAVPKARLVVVGAGGNERELQKLARNLRLDDAVEFTGRQPREMIPSYIAASTVCLVPYTMSVQTNASGPQKLFQYMAMGKPIVVSSMASLSRIIGETGGGLVYTAENAEALADAVIRLYGDKDLASQMGQAGLAAVRTRYDWSIEGKKLLELYRGLEEGMGNGE